MPATTYAANKILDHMLGTASWTMPSQVYLAVFTTATTDGGGGTEVTLGAGYARQAVDFDAASGKATDATADAVFGPFTADKGTATHGALMDAATGGNMIAHGPLAANKTLENGDTFRFPAADIDALLS